MISRIWAILLQEFFITRKSLEIIMDLPFMSVVTVLVFGFISKYLSNSQSTQAASFLLVGMVLWEVIRVNQYSISIGALWNVWSKNLSNMFITPLSLTEYFIAQMLSGLIKTLIVFLIALITVQVAFNFSLLDLGVFNLIIYFVNLTVFAWSTGLVILGVILRWGTRVQALSWGLVFLLQPLSAVFFPLEVLPNYLQKVALIIPSTYIFEAARQNLASNFINNDYIIKAIVGNIIYFMVALLVFYILYQKSKESGQFARNEG